MSINTLTNAAIARRPDFAPMNRVPEGLSEIALAAAGMPTATAGPAVPPGAGETSANGVATALNVLTGYIPTEVLTLYVAVVAAMHPASKAAVTSSDWAAFWVFLIATPIVAWVVYAAKVKSAQKSVPLAFAKWPVWEMLAATVAFCAWAFAMTSTPFEEYSWYSAALAGVTVLVTSTILGLLAPLFQNRLPP